MGGRHSYSFLSSKCYLNLEERAFKFSRDLPRICIVAKCSFLHGKSLFRVTIEKNVGTSEQ